MHFFLNGFSYNWPALPFYDLFLWEIGSRRELKLVNIFLVALQGLDHVAENILSFLDAKSLCAAGAVSKEWARVISEGMLWKKLIERKVNTDSLWKGLADRRNWIQYLFKPKPGESHPPHSFYRGLYPSIIKDIDVSSRIEILGL